MDAEEINSQLDFIPKKSMWSISHLVSSEGLFEASDITGWYTTVSSSAACTKMPVVCYPCLWCSLLLWMFTFCCTFSVLDNDLFIIVLDNTAIKASAHCCFRCSAFGHEVVKCTFPLAAPLDKENHQGKKGPSMPQGEWSNQASAFPPAQAPPLAAIFPLLIAKKMTKFWSKKCGFSHCRWVHVCRNCKQSYQTSRCGTLAHSPLTTLNIISEVIQIVNGALGC